MEQQEQQQDEGEIRAIVRKRENDFNVIKQRIDTNPLLEQFQTFLTGSKTVYVEDQETGDIKSKSIIYGSPKANDKGIQTIMQRVNCIVNTHTIQGNFPLDSKAHSESYEDYCYGCEIDFATDIMINLPDYEIDESEYQGILNSLMASIKPIMSRCIDNKERDSYGETSQHIERHDSNPKQGVFKNI